VVVFGFIVGFFSSNGLGLGLDIMILALASRIIVLGLDLGLVH